MKNLKGKRQGNCINKTKRKSPLEKVNFYENQYLIIIKLFELSQVVYVRAEGPKALSPGQRPQAARPERAEALSPGQRPGYNGNRQGAL